jgi:hypothetical protein
VPAKGGVAEEGRRIRSICANVADLVTRHSGEIRLGSFAEFGSAISLCLFIAICIYRLRLLRISSAGEQIATLGGIATPIMLAGSAMAKWSLTRPGVAAAPGAVQALQSIGFDGEGRDSPFSSASLPAECQLQQVCINSSVVDVVGHRRCSCR